MGTIKAIIFDYFGVICSDEYWQYVKQDKNVESSFKHLADDVNLGKVHWAEFINEIAAKTSTSVEEVMRLYQSARINPEFIGYIAGLRKNYQTALLTNAHYEFLEPMLKAAKLDEAFDTVVISSRVGFIKPAREIYEFALGKLNVLPDEAVFIDDIRRNVEGARQVGLHAILYEDFQQMKRELERLLTYPND